MSFCFASRVFKEKKESDNQIFLAAKNSICYIIGIGKFQIPSETSITSLFVLTANLIQFNSIISNTV